MATLRIEKPCDEPNLDAAKRAVEDYLSSIGYELVEANGKRLKFKFVEGKWYAGKLSDGAHNLSVLLTGSSVRCDVGHWLANEEHLAQCRADFERIASGIARAVETFSRRKAERKKEAAPRREEPIAQHTVERQVVVTRCKFCQHLTPVDLDTCKNCGAAKFC